MSFPPTFPRVVRNRTVLRRASWRRAIQVREVEGGGFCMIYRDTSSAAGARTSKDVRPLATPLTWSSIACSPGW